MEYRFFGQSGLRVSVPSMGTFSFGNRGDLAGVVNPGVEEAHVHDPVAAVELCRTGEDRARLDEERAIPQIYPIWHQRNVAHDRFSPGGLALHQDVALDWAAQENERTIT